ncbi:amino acid racemase [Acidaminobacter sp. JC074]|uniref:aspartate/glutamate racemase family protein n=1 Tax=Acidaminobacter sp. JC074 TaxID=2530199 RepID=UPI001F0E26B9|nr:amino acid racemase [Acidaminobacter sp. JC074]MCH4886888.1 amino acid racemase [Acidaminobacter sp. JC074]
MNDRILGIIGGMGPEATVSFYRRIIALTEVTCDQDHYRVIIDSNPKIPDRTSSILKGTQSPLPALIDTAKNLEKLGVVTAGIPCITAHYYIDELRKHTSIDIVSAIEAVDYKLRTKHKGKTVGILATTGTVKTGLFSKQLENPIIYPTDDSQEKKVMEAIYGKEGIKNVGITKRSLNLLIAAGNELIERGAEVIIAGCTEIGVILNQDHVNCAFIDPMDVLAEEMLKDE